MATSVVESLFGLSPDTVRRQEMAQLNQNAFDFAGLNPAQQGAALGYQAGGLLARGGASLLGLQTPQEQMAQQQQQIQSQIDHSTPEGLLRGAELFNRAGNARMAFMYQQAAAARQQEMANLARTQAQEMSALAQAQKALKPNESEDPAKYASDIQRLILDRNRYPVGSNEYNIIDRRINALIRKENAAAEKVGSTGIPKPPTGYRYTANGDLEPIPGGPKDNTSKQAAARDRARTKAQLVISKINEAITQVSPLSAGVVGQTTAAIGGTPAANLEATIDTIQANIGFDELQAMRDASPTGGALGQVAIRELDMLQSTLASLKQKQSPDQLKSNLNKILGHYNNWLKTVNEAAVQEGGASINPNETQTTQRKRIKFDAQGNIVK